MHCIGAQHLRGRNSYHRKAESNMIILLLGLLQLGHGQSNQIKATRYREHQELFLTIFGLNLVKIGLYIEFTLDIHFLPFNNGVQLSDIFPDMIGFPL